MPTQCSILAWEIPRKRGLAGHNPRGHKESETTWAQLTLNTAYLHPSGGRSLTGVDDNDHRHLLVLNGFHWWIIALGVRQPEVSSSLNLNS